MKKGLLLIAVLFIIGRGYGQKVVTGNPLDYVGDTVTISGKVYGGAFLKNVKTKPTLLNLGDSIPNHRLIIRIDTADRDKFPSTPETYYLQKKISVTGVVENYKGTGLIKVSDPSAITMEQPVPDSSAYTTNPIFNNQVVQGETETAKTETEPANAASETIKRIHAEDAKRRAATVRADSLLQSAWIKSVEDKTSYEEGQKNTRVVKKKIPLSISPANSSPVIADLKPGIVLTILLKSNKWSYISVRNTDGTSTVFGFIKNRRLKYLKKQKGPEAGKEKGTEAGKETDKEKGTEAKKETGKDVAKENGPEAGKEKNEEKGKEKVKAKKKWYCSKYYRWPI